MDGKEANSVREGRGGKIDYLGKRRRWMGKGEDGWEKEKDRIVWKRGKCLVKRHGCRQKKEERE